MFITASFIVQRQKEKKQLPSVEKQINKTSYYGINIVFNIKAIYVHGKAWSILKTCTFF